jgi:hypothetical protein
MRLPLHTLRISWHADFGNGEFLDKDGFFEGFAVAVGGFGGGAGSAEVGVGQEEAVGPVMRAEMLPREILSLRLDTTLIMAGGGCGMKGKTEK